MIGFDDGASLSAFPSLMIHLWPFSVFSAKGKKRNKYCKDEGIHIILLVITATWQRLSCFQLQMWKRYAIHLCM